jgi:hypothetical protein
MKTASDRRRLDAPQFGVAAHVVLSGGMALKGAPALDSLEVWARASTAQRMADVHMGQDQRPTGRH